MITKISNNPFRVLGVFVNASLKAITANKGKMLAFAKVGKAMTWSMDMNSVLSPPHRSVDNIDRALSVINLPEDKISHAFFWFINTSPMDEVALNHLQNGNYEKASEIFAMKKSYSSLLNRGVLALMQKDLEVAVGSITELIHQDEYRDSFIEAICGSTFVIREEELAKLFIDELLSCVSASQLLEVFKSCGTSSFDDNYIRNIVVEEYICLINREIGRAKGCGDSASDEYNAGVELINNTTNALNQLRGNLSPTDLQYQTNIDALARQILQCGINYFNAAAADDDDAVDKAMMLQKYALSISVSQSLKDRCEENIEVLIKQIETHKIRKELGRLSELIERFTNKDRSEAIAEEKFGHLGFSDLYITPLSAIEHFVREGNKELSIISHKIGPSSKYYIDLSDIVATVALDKLIDSINKAQSIRNTSKSDINGKITKAISIMDEIGRMHLIGKTRIFLNENKKILDGIYKKLNPDWFEENMGCVVFIIIGLIIAIIASLL